MAAFAEYSFLWGGFKGRTLLWNSQEHRVLGKEENQSVMEVPIGDRWESQSETKQIGISLTLSRHTHSFLSSRASN